LKIHIPKTQDNVSYAVGLEVLVAMLVGALVLFLLGMKRYSMESPKGSPITSIAQVFVAACGKWRVKDTGRHENYWYGYDHGSFREHHSQSPPKIQTLVHTDQYRYIQLSPFITFLFE
jgi:hypothetical protein